MKSAQRALALVLVVGAAALGIAAPASAAVGDVSGATLDWGFKQSFRSYITGPIANGFWTVSGVSDAVPFGFSGGSGSNGDVAYPGTIHFQGHKTGASYALDLTLSDVHLVRTSATAATIVLDVTTNSFASATTFTTSDNVAFANVNLAAGTATATGVDNATTTVTAAGAAAFSGFYGAGDALDPLSFSWPVEQAQASATNLEWGVQKAFRDFVTGTTVAGTITSTATTASGAYLFAGTSGGGYQGSVHFAGLSGALDLTLADPSVSGDTLSLSVNGAAPLAFATLSTASATSTVAAGITTYANTPAVLTAAGAAALSVGGAQYEAGDALDPVTFSVVTPLAAAVAPAGSVATVVPATPVAATPVATAVTLSAKPALLEVGDTTTLTAKVTPAIAGSFTFTEGKKVLGTKANGKLNVTKLTKGDHTYTATFTPDSAGFAASSDTATVVVEKKASAAAAETKVAAGSLTWGIKQSFRSYVTGSIAKGAISTSGAGSSGGAFVFGQSSSDTAKYTGSVRFTGHAGVLDLTFANPSVDVKAKTLSVSVNGTRVVIANLALGKGVKAANGTVRYAPAAATLTAAGSSVFSYQDSTFYPAGTALDPVTVVIGSVSAPVSSAATVATYVKPATTPSPTATPTAASAAAATDATCVASDAALTWGFKESFRSYISGSIANGKWEVADGATYATPDFGFTGAGTYDGTTGLIAFPGSIRFTGHDGVLDTTVANPQLRFDSTDSATMLLDVAGTTQDGEAIAEKGVEFVTLDLTKATITEVDGVTTITAAPTALTDAGATSFGTYESGVAFDPVTVSFAAACATTTGSAPEAAAGTPATAAPTATASNAPTSSTATSNVDGLVIPWSVVSLVLAILLLAAIAAIVLLAVLLVRRRT